jgi:ubiquinone/menaquinone biosynthesis C-methylase UbiE
MPATGRFCPGIIDYNDMSSRYQSGRALSGEAAKTWIAAVAPFVQRSARPRILDLGAGTGRFAALFALSLEATVVGIEPSTGMLAVAANHPKPNNLAYLAGTAECIPLADATCDLAWLSHVWHHIRDHRACADDLRRVLRRGGHVLVRGTFGDRLDGFPTLFQFWPGARAICEQLPTIGETVGVVETSGLELAQHRRIQQQTAASLSEFAKRTRSRADSALALISESEFQEGQTAIDTAAAVERGPVPVVEIIELLVFRKGSIRNAA